MQKIIIITAVTAMLLTACQTANPSKTWALVKAVQKTGPGIENRSSVYADRLHKVLLKEGVEHKIVTFTFKYPSLRMVDATAQDTAVIYKDTDSPNNPWWLVAEWLWSPVWLPTQSIPRQVDFFLARPSTVVSVEEFPSASPKTEKHEHDRVKTGKAKPSSKPARPAKKKPVRTEIAGRFPSPQLRASLPQLL